MPGLKLYNESNLDALLVPGYFIDTYMPQASGEFVKVYLSLLRQAAGEDAGLTVSGLADFLNCTENDVVRALKYWERMGLLRLEGADGTLTGIALLTPGAPVKEETAVRAEAAVAVTSVPAAASLPERDNGLLKKLEKDEEFKQFLFVAEKYMGSLLTRRDCDTFAYLYGQLKMPGELLEYLIEYCVSMGHKSVRYMETVALDLHQKGIKTAAQAKSALPAMRKGAYAVMKAFGLSGRLPAAGEQEMIDRWFGEYGFSRELVLEACGRTVAAIHKPSFEYADKILAAWRENGVKTMWDVKVLDEKRSRQKESKTGAPKGSQPRRSGGRPNQFHNFEQREYDFDELIKQINQQQ